MATPSAISYQPPRFLLPMRLEGRRQNIDHSRPRSRRAHRMRIFACGGTRKRHSGQFLLLTVSRPELAPSHFQALGNPRARDGGFTPQWRAIATFTGGPLIV